VSGTTSSAGECSTARRRPAVVGAHYSAIETPLIRREGGTKVSDYKTVAVGESVELEWETPGQDGFDYRAVVVRHVA
jgi:hypothetical protein